MTNRFAPVPPNWWSRPLPDIMAALKAHPDGLRQENASERLEIYGLNQLADHHRDSILVHFLKKILNPLLLLLLAASVISALTGELSNFIIITVILAVSTGVDVYQEHQADTSAEKLRKRVSLTATVYRDSVKKEILFSQVVPGDIINLSVGDIVPADARLLSSKEFVVDQSTLTGESFPQTKNFSNSVRPAAAISDRINSVFMGTSVVAGEANAVVVTTGTLTEFGHISKSLVAPRPPTEFEKGINAFALMLMKVAFLSAGFVLAAHLLLSRDLLTSFEFVLALVIGFAPELLPVIMTINLSRGAVRMSHKGVIVKYLPSIENLGSMEILATDKTGTLTENSISLTGHEDISGKNEEKVLLFGFVSSLFQTGFKGPLETAIMAHEKKLKTTGYTYLESIPFDFFRKRHSVIVRHNSQKILITKGAPEEIFNIMHYFDDAGSVKALNSQHIAKIKSRFEEISAKGLRTLAVSYRIFPSTKVKFSHKDESDVVFLGFLTFTDPPKKSTIESLATLMNSGVEVKVLTGDNELVTEQVCKELNLPVSGIINGIGIDKLKDDELGVIALRTTIFARLNPDQKERILKALRSTGKVVGFLGDGINDAQSLRAADIGISVNNASDIAKASADIILLHKDLHVLHEGVIEGRRTFGNALKYIMMGTSSTFGNMISVSIASIFLPFLPLLPVQVLLNDMLYDSSQLLIATDKVDHFYVAKPKKWDIHFIERFMAIFGSASSIFDLVTFALLLYVLRATVPLFQTGWFLESIVTQTLIVFSIRTALVPFWRSRPDIKFTLSLITITIVAIILPYTPLGVYFSFVRVPLKFYAILAGIVAVYFILAENLKIWFYKHGQQS